MALDDLKETIETLRERIQTHRPYLEGYETRTRQVLIDPMLHKLGWDVGDPDSVKLEYSINQQRVDYALMGHKTPVAVIEAKALGKPLDEKETMQVLNYANTAGIPYMTLTNGDHWRMLEVFKQAPIKDRILMNFQLTQDEPYACALQALGLWRPNLASGKPQEAATPVLIEKAIHAESAPTISEPSRKKKVAESSKNGDWVPLTSLKVEKGQKVPANATIMFPDSSTKPIKNWIDLWDNVANYLIEIGKISAQDCPVRKKADSVTYFLHTKPFHRSGRKFDTPREIKNDLWLERFHGNIVTMVKNSCWLLDKFGVNPSSILVSTNQS